MRGLFVVEKNVIDILELREPEPGPYEALVAVEACGICNSTDWKIVKGEFVSGSFPILLGHESVGRVVRVGNQVRSFRERDRVLRSTLRDEHLPFHGGRSCWGGFVEWAIVTDVWAEKGTVYNAFAHPQQIVPPDIPSTDAVATITLKETLSCLENTGVPLEGSLAIVGTGPVGQALAYLSKLKGIAPVVVFGRRPHWSGVFAELGADAYVCGEDLAPAARDIVNKGGFDCVIEAVGTRDALSRCLNIVKPDGRINLYGVTAESEPYLPEQTSDPRVFRSKVAEAEAHDQILDWVVQGKLDLGDWTSHELPWTDYERGFEMVASKEANKAVLTMQAQ
jgi:threonine dehydrogenase-like Zn-dependent dehydrogenase